MAILTGIATRRASRSAMELCEVIDISTERGLLGDSRGKPGRRQVTVLSQESWQAACDSLHTDLPWTLRRANLLVQGLTFDASHVGWRLRLGDAELEICYECDPCPRMDEQHQGLTAALQPDWRGGVCCRVIRAGTVRLGTRVSLEPAAL